jgi:late competence protein required for DNA uptake (superfamily II DNA/RNA helicase)
MLNKEFKRKDVERMRNLIKGKSGESSELQVGYTTKKENHKEGDIWEEKGKTWTIKDGIKQTATKLDKVKKEAILPLFCPNCSSLMKNQNDPKMYKIHKMCFSCVIDEEHKLKIEGKYEEYEKNLVANNAKDYLDHLESYLLEAINTSNTQYVSEKGEVERWKGGISKDKFTDQLETNFKEFRKQVDDYKNNKTDDKT